MVHFISFFPFFKSVKATTTDHPPQLRVTCCQKNWENLNQMHKTIRICHGVYGYVHVSQVPVDKRYLTYLSHLFLLTEKVEQKRKQCLKTFTRFVAYPISLIFHRCIVENNVWMQQDGFVCLCEALGGFWCHGNSLYTVAFQIACKISIIVDFCHRGKTHSCFFIYFPFPYFAGSLDCGQSNWTGQFGETTKYTQNIECIYIFAK